MVTTGLQWPRRRETVTGSAPAAIKALAWLWRSACKLTLGRPRAVGEPLPVLGDARGRADRLRWSPKMKASSERRPAPSATRSSN